MDELYKESPFTCIEQVKAALEEQKSDKLKIRLDRYAEFIDRNEIHPSEYIKRIKTDINLEYVEYIKTLLK